MQRQRALADPAFAGAHGHEMAHPREPIGDAGALLGNLLEDPGPSVADDVLVALHFAGMFCGLIAYTGRARPGRARGPDRALHRNTDAEGAAQWRPLLLSCSR